MSAAVGRGPMGARRAALVAERWLDSRLAVHQSGARLPSSDGAAILAVLAAEIQRMPVPVPAGVDLQTAAARGAGAAPADGPADAGQSVPRDSSAVLPRDATPRRVADHGRVDRRGPRRVAGRHYRRGHPLAR